MKWLFSNPYSNPCQRNKNKDWNLQVLHQHPLSPLLPWKCIGLLLPPLIPSRWVGGDADGGRWVSDGSAVSRFLQVYSLSCGRRLWVWHDFGKGYCLHWRRTTCARWQHTLVAPCLLSCCTTLTTLLAIKTRTITKIITFIARTVGRTTLRVKGGRAPRRLKSTWEWSWAKSPNKQPVGVYFWQ